MRHFISHVLQGDRGAGTVAVTVAPAPTHASEPRARPTLSVVATRATASFRPLVPPGYDGTVNAVAGEPTPSAAPASPPAPAPTAKDVAPAAAAAAPAGADKPTPVPFRQLFRFATWGDVTLMCIALTMAAATGAVIPLSSLVLGELINAVAQPANMVENVSALHCMCVSVRAWRGGVAGGGWDSSTSARARR
jgi:hypothetical protein